jgi:hypothetical protein
MSKHCRTAFLSLALLGLAGSAVAQKAEIPKITPTKTVKSKTELPTPPVLEQNAGVMVAPRLQLKEQLATGTFQHNYAGGDLATYWISPLLTNHDSRMSGNLYTVDGNTVHQRFGFSVVNSSLEPLDVTLSCINEAGDAVPKYSAVLKLKPYGSAAWNTNQIEPSRTTDQVTADADRVWCGLTANRPFAAFGTMTRSSGTSSTSSIALIAAAR